jgi:hypothetical protein
MSREIIKKISQGLVHLHLDGAVGSVLPVKADGCPLAGRSLEVGFEHEGFGFVVFDEGEGDEGAIFNAWRG